MKSLKLNYLENKEMANIKGGFIIHRHCSCSCYYADSGGSTIDGNFSANFNKGPEGAHSTEGTVKKELEINIEVP